MEGIKKNNYIDETLISTPRPRAASTEQKPRVVKQLVLNRIPFNYSLSTPGSSALNSTDSKGGINEKLLQHRFLANSLLQKSKNFGLPSHYLKESESIQTESLSQNTESTVNETDLLNSPKTDNQIPVRDVQLPNQNVFNFKPDDISTPRNSLSSVTSNNERMSINSVTKSLVELSEQIKTSDLSLSELCKQFCENVILDNSRTSQDFEFQEESFVTGELAEEKIAKQEKLWHEEHDIGGANNITSDSVFSELGGSDSNRTSVSDFFQKKSELADLCLKESPVRKTAPFPLINNSTSFEQSTNLSHEDQSVKSLDSVLSISEIQKVISSNDTHKIMDMLTKVKKSASDKENKPPRNSELKFEYSTNSNEPLKDSRNIVQRQPSMGRSGSSLRTISSLDYLPDGKLPIECNRTELVWGSIPLGKRNIQTFILRNKSEHKLRLQITSRNSNFKILNDHSEYDTILILPVVLYPSESRSFSIMFSPTVIGSYAEKLEFFAISSELQLQQTKRQQLMMFGYGGRSNVEIESVLKDTNMKMWLSLGKLNNSSQVSQCFTVNNIGNVSAFCCLMYKSKALFGSTRVTIDPKEVVLRPKEKLTVKVTYSPTKDDIKQLFAMTQNQIIDIGVIHTIAGEEVLRGRIRRLFRKLKKEGKIIGNPLIEQLSAPFPNEDIPVDVQKFTETVASMKDLMRDLVSKEVVLTMERDSENSLSGQIAGMDNTSMFYSISEGMTTMFAPKTATTSCLVEPTNIILRPPIKSEDFVMLISQHSTRLQFETIISPKNGLEISPSQGILMPGETVILNIASNTRQINSLQEIFKIFIYVDDDVYEVTVKVILVKGK